MWRTSRALWTVLLTACSGPPVVSPNDGSMPSDASTQTDGNARHVPDSGPSIVHACDGLMAPEVWEQVSLPPNMRTSTVAVDPHESGGAYFGCEPSAPDPARGVWRSNDCGATLTHVSTGALADQLQAGGQWTMFVDPIEPDLVFANSGYGQNGLFRSNNRGVDWTVVWPPADPTQQSIVDYNFVGAIYPDPSDHAHLLLSFHAACLGSYAPGCYGETFDSGSTWRIVRGDGPLDPEARPYVIGPTRWLIPSGGALWLTEDSGATYRNVGNFMAGGHSAGDLLVTENGIYLGCASGVLRSGDNGASWELVPQSGSWIKAIVRAGDWIVASGNGGVVRSRIDDGRTWTLMPGSPTHSDGCFMSYDAGYRLLYASCMAEGLWRAVIEP